jgi:small-conductance mechanosensitive channel
MDFIVMGNSLTTWAIALSVCAGLTAVFLMIRHIAVKRLSLLTQNTETYVDDVIVGMLSATRMLFLVLVALYLCRGMVELSTLRETQISRIMVVVLLVQIALWGDRGIRLWLAHCLEKARVEDAGRTTSTSALGMAARLVLWVVVLLMILDNLNFNISALVASLGIGGIAVALAMQNILGDIFSSLAIVLDKPFVVGDFIVIDAVSGTVEFIGLKTTRVRSLSGEQIVFSNTDLLGSRIRNYKHMQERRIVFNLTLAYQTTEEQLRAIPKIVQEAVEAEEGVRFERAHFAAFAESSLNFEVVYHVVTPDYNMYMDAQQAINLALFSRFSKEKIQFAFPSRTVYLVNPEQAALTSQNRQNTQATPEE